MWRFIGNEKHKLSLLGKDKELLSYFSIRSLIIASAFATGALVSIFSPTLAKFSPVLIFPGLKIINHKFKSVIEKYKRERG